MIIFSHLQPSFWQKHACTFNDKHFDISQHQNEDTEELCFLVEHMNFEGFLCPVGIGQLLMQKDLIGMHLLSPWGSSQKNTVNIVRKRSLPAMIWEKTDSYLKVISADFADNISADWISIGFSCKKSLFWLILRIIRNF